MAEAFALIWFAAAICGVLGVVLALVTGRTRRRAWLFVAGVCFGLAGVLGILSIGVILIVASAACLVAVSRTRDTTATIVSDR